MNAATNGHSGTTSRPSRRASSSAVATRRAAEPAALERLVHLGVDERDTPVATVVGGLADHPLAVSQLVA